MSAYRTLPIPYWSFSFLSRSSYFHLITCSGYKPQRLFAEFAYHPTYCCFPVWLRRSAASTLRFISGIIIRLGLFAQVLLITACNLPVYDLQCMIPLHQVWKFMWITFINYLCRKEWLQVWKFMWITFINYLCRKEWLQVWINTSLYLLITVLCLQTPYLYLPKVRWQHEKQRNKTRIRRRHHAIVKQNLGTFQITLRLSNVTFRCLFWYSSWR